MVGIVHVKIHPVVFVFITSWEKLSLWEIEDGESKYERKVFLIF